MKGLFDRDKPVKLVSWSVLKDKPTIRIMLVLVFIQLVRVDYNIPAIAPLTTS